MGLWSYLIPEGGKRMTLIELSIKMSKTAPAKTCTVHNDWKQCCIFQEEKNEDLTQRPTNSPEYRYGCYTMIAMNMQYLSSMPSGTFVLDHTKLDKAHEAPKRNNALAPGRCRCRMQLSLKAHLSTAAGLKTLRKLSRSNRGVRVTNFRIPSSSSGTWC